MGFHFAAAPLHLAHCVRAFWGFDARDAGGGPEERIVPDGCAEIVVHFADPFRERVGAAYHEQSRALFAGQITMPLWLRAGASADVFALRLQPDGARCLGLPPQSMLTDTRVAFEDVVPAPRRGEWRETLEALRDARSFDARVLTMQTFVERSLKPAAPDAMSWCVAAITRQAGDCELAHVARGAGLSTRQLQRRFLSDVGVTPKLFARIVRFQRALQRWDARPGDWARVASECGYYDQPHLLRDFRQFAGEPPAALMAALAPLGASLVAAR
jgi:AraC-like DNA-binding protein